MLKESEVSKMNIYKKITEKIIEKMEDAENKGTVFRWVKPFDITESVRFPCNYESLTPYNGINRLLVEPDEYITFHQLNQFNNRNKGENFRIRAGSKGFPIIYYNWDFIKDNDGNIKTDDDGNPLKRPFVRYYTVFSRQDIVNEYGENLYSKFPTKHFSHEEMIKIISSELNRFAEMVFDYCQQNGLKLEIINDGTSAYFSFNDGVIRVPSIVNFNSVYEYVSTISHELIHSTIVSLGRCTPQELKDTKKYSQEELVAEIGANMLVSNFMIPDDSEIDNNIAYIQHWRSYLENDSTKSVILYAARQAQKACDLITNNRIREHILNRIDIDPEAYNKAPDYIKNDYLFATQLVNKNPILWDILPEDVKSEIKNERNDTDELLIL